MKKITCVAVAISLLISGCSVFVPKTQMVDASCSESDATLQVNGGQTFEGQGQVAVRRNKGASFVCYKPGYYPAQKTVSASSLSWTGVADLVGSFVLIFPVIGIFTPGAWDLDETHVNLNMVKY